MRSATRLGAVVVLLLVPGIVSTWSHAAALAGRIAQSDLEREGVEALTPLLVAAVASVLAVYTAVAVTWRTRHDARQIVDGVEAVARGDHTPRPLPDGADELGDIGRAVLRARDSLAATEAELRVREAERDALTRDSFQKQQEATAHIRLRAQTMIDEASEVVLRQLSDVVDQVSAIRAAADAIDAHVEQADRVTAEVVGQASDTDGVVDTLGESLRRVGGMAKLIAGVADQSKMLALNATIEAARAGEAGRGFGVVAGEVKELATATGSSTDQISSTVADLERDTAAVSAAIGRMGHGIRGIDAATSSLREVADRQRAVVDALDHVVTTSMERIRAMTTLKEKLERRGHDRVQVGVTAIVTCDGTVLDGRVEDLSASGARVHLDARLDSPWLQPGASCTVEAHLAGEPARLTGTIVHVVGADGGGVDLGVRFGPLGGDMARLLSQALAQPV
jgi:methyl-accepting chemotaxis protein